MATNLDWADAFRRQAASDFALYRHLAGGSAPVEPCHALHHLQMATEKIAKAYRLVGEPGATPASIAEHELGNFVEDSFLLLHAARRLRLGKHNLRHAKRKLTETARKVEGLVPGGLMHRNAEYPWEVAGTVCTPAVHDFADLEADKIVDFLKFLKLAIDEFDS